MKLQFFGNKLWANPISVLLVSYCIISEYFCLRMKILLEISQLKAFDKNFMVKLILISFRDFSTLNTDDL